DAADAKKDYSTRMTARIRWVAPGARWTEFSPALAASTQRNSRQSSGAMSARAAAFAIQGFQTTVAAEPLFSTTMRRAQAGSSRTQVAAVFRWTWSVSLAMRIGKEGWRLRR